jgi:hypothetical protein
MSEINIKNMLDSHISKLDGIIIKKQIYVTKINFLSEQINKIKLNNTELKRKLKEIETQLNNKEKKLLIEIEQLKMEHENELKKYQKQIDRLNNIHGLNDDNKDTVENTD